MRKDIMVGGGNPGGALHRTLSVQAAQTLAEMKRKSIEQVDHELSAQLEEDCAGHTHKLSLSAHIEADEKDEKDPKDIIAEILLSLSAEDRASHGHRGGSQDIPGKKIRKKEWDNEQEGEWVRIWHLLFKKVSEISMAASVVSFPGVVGAVTSAVCALSLSYLDAIFFIALHILLGGLTGAALTYIGSITLTAGAYVAIKTFVQTYIINDGPASRHVLNAASALDIEIVNGFGAAWDSTRDIVPQIVKDVVGVADSASDIFADIFVTRLIRDRYDYSEDPQGLDSVACTGRGLEGVRKLFEEPNQGKLLNVEITDTTPVAEVVERTNAIQKRRQHRIAIFAGTALGQDVMAVLYNKKIDQDVRRAAASEQAAAEQAAASQAPSRLTHTSSAPSSGRSTRGEDRHKPY